MVLGEIPPGFKAKVTAGLAITPVSGGIEIEKGVATRVRSLRTAVNYLHATLPIGSVDKLSSWFEGVLPMKMVELNGHPEVAFFVADGPSHLLVLGGSRKHVIGDKQFAASYAGQSHLTRLLNNLREFDEYPARVKELTKGDEAVERITRETISAPPKPWTATALQFANNAAVAAAPAQKIAFMARLLVSGPNIPGAPGLRVTVATPIYVALADA